MDVCLKRLEQELLSASQAPWTFKFCTDASSSGWGATILHQQEAAGWWHKDVAFKHLNYRELLAVLKALQSFQESINGKNVQILSDNVTTVAYINRMGGNSKELNDLMNTIWVTARRTQSESILHPFSRSFKLRS